MMEEYEKKYKTAVGQIKLSGADKQELLEAVKGQKGVAKKGKKMPFYLGGTVAAAVLVLIVAGNSHMFFSGGHKNNIRDEGAEGVRMSDSTQEENSEPDYGQEDFDSEGAASKDIASEEDMVMNSPSEAENELAKESTSGNGEMVTADSLFCIIAYDEDIELLDKAGSSSKDNAGNQYDGQESAAVEKNSARVLEPGNSYGAYSMEAPSCTMAMFANDGGACDGYRIRVAGGVVKLVTGEGTEEKETQELQVKDGERFCIRATDEFTDKDGMQDGKGTYAGLEGMEENVWQDEGTVTVTQVLIEGMKGHKVVDTRRIYVGQKGERYYGLVQ